MWHTARSLQLFSSPGALPFDREHSTPPPCRWKSPPGDTKIAVKTAIKCGYRNIDAANDYNNEHEVGEAIQECIAEGIVTREELFIQVSRIQPRNLPPCLSTSTPCLCRGWCPVGDLAGATSLTCEPESQAKLWNSNHRPEHIMGDLEQSLKDLQVDYLDSWVIHWPMAVPASGKFCATRVSGSGAKTGPWEENPVSLAATSMSRTPTLTTEVLTLSATDVSARRRGLLLLGQ